MGRWIAPMAALILVTALSGCSHQADFHLFFINDTDQPLVVVLEAMDEAGASALKRTATVGENATEYLGQVSLERGTYVYVASAGGHRTEETIATGSGLLGLDVKVTELGIELIRTVS